MTIIPFTPQHLPEAEVLLAQAFGHSYKEHINHDLRGAFLEKPWLRPHYIVGSVKKEMVSIVGWAPASHSLSSYSVFWVATKKKFQRKGYAGQLLNMTISDILCHHKSCGNKNALHCSITLSCVEELVPFYMANGFELIGTLALDRYMMRYKPASLHQRFKIVKN